MKFTKEALCSFTWGVILFGGWLALHWCVISMAKL